MKKLTLMLILSVLPCVGQTPFGSTREDPERTIGGLNGRFWQKSTPNGKVYWLVGFDEGIGHGDPDREKILFSRKVNYGETLKGIDRFYEDPENVFIPIYMALEIFTLKVNGATQAEIEAKLAGFRRYIKSTEELLKAK